MKGGSTLNILAKDLMNREVISVSSDTTLRDAWQIFSENKISGAPVVDKDGVLVGVVSQHDLVRRILSESEINFDMPSYYYGLPKLSDSFIPSGNSLSDLQKTLVEEVMNPYVITVKPEDPLPMIAATMRSHHIHRVIVARAGKIEGVISTFDLLSLVENQ